MAKGLYLGPWRANDGSSRLSWQNVRLAHGEYEVEHNVKLMMKVMVLKCPYVISMTLDMSDMKAGSGVFPIRGATGRPRHRTTCMTS